MASKIIRNPKHKKLYEGTATIELIDAQTGEIKEKQIQHNTITDSLEQYYSQAPIWPRPYMWGPGEMLSGLALFKEQIDEKKKENFLLGDIEPDAWASNYDKSTSSTKRGHFEAAAEVINANSITRQWYFTASQAVGNISAISLIHPAAGMSNNAFMDNIALQRDTPYAGLFSTSDDRSTLFHADLENGFLYGARLVDEGATLKVMKYKFNNDKVNLNFKNTIAARGINANTIPSCLTLIDSAFFTLNTNLETLMTASNKNYLVQSLAFYGNTLYIFVPNTPNVIIEKITFSNIEHLSGSLTEQTIDLSNYLSSAYGKNIQVWHPYGSSFGMAYRMMHQAIPFDGKYLYIKTSGQYWNAGVQYNPLSVYKININDLTDASRIWSISHMSSEYSTLLPFTTGGMMMGNYMIDGAINETVNLNTILNNYVFVWNFKKGTVKHTKIADIPSNHIYNIQTNKNNSNTLMLNDTIALSYNLRAPGGTEATYCCTYLAPGYLGTINNIQTITKSSNDILKITYTLTQINQ